MFFSTKGKGNAALKTKNLQFIKFLFQSRFSPICAVILSQFRGKFPFFASLTVLWELYVLIFPALHKRGMN